jgi:itaconyl-CoA hydratase
VTPQVSDQHRLTSQDNYFEDFIVGDLFRHARGKTIGEFDNTILTNLVMNTADNHFNDHRMSSEAEGRRIVFGGATIALVLGLAMQDTGEHALVEVGMNALRLSGAVLEGDTLYAFTKVLEKWDDNIESGIVAFRHWGVNQRSEIVFTGDRKVRLSKRPRSAP